MNYIFAHLTRQRYEKFQLHIYFWDILHEIVMNCLPLHLVMNKGLKETITIRIISTSFAVLALAVFKPFGLDAWQWEAYAHLVTIGVLGVGCCMITDLILKYIVRMPRSYKKGVSYIIQRNLRFQFINTPLVALMICLYRHFVLNDLIEGNQLSWANFFETLFIIAFCSFAIGLYWRFKFRGKYLAMELEETRQLNEQLQKMNQENKSPESTDNRPASLIHQPIELKGTTNESVRLQVADLLYIETVGNYVKVYHLRDGQVRNDMLRATSKQMEEELQAFPMVVRCHRAFLVNMSQVQQIISKAGSMQLLMKHSQDSIPVSRSNMAQIREAIKGV